MAPAVALEIANLRRNYGALRPLRVQALTVAGGERVAVEGLDAAAAEQFVNLVTGAALPDEGEVRVFGRPTSAIADGDEWLASLDRFGIVSHRAVLLEGATLLQNLALPFTLEIDPVPEGVAGDIAALAAECGIPADVLHTQAGETSAAVRARVHLARAIALRPALLLLEHPTASIPEPERPAFADDLVRICEARTLAAVVITTDHDFAKAVAHRTLSLQGGTGALVAPPQKRWW